MNTEMKNYLRLKKWRPPKLIGRMTDQPGFVGFFFTSTYRSLLASPQLAAISRTLRLLVFVANTHSSGACRSSNRKRSCLTLMFSTIASTTRSAPLTACIGSVVVVTFENTACRDGVDEGSFFASRSSDTVIMFLPLERASSVTSHNVTWCDFEPKC